LESNASALGGFWSPTLKSPKLKLWTPKNRQSVGLQKIAKAEALDSKKSPKLKLWTPISTLESIIVNY